MEQFLKRCESIIDTFNSGNKDKELWKSFYTSDCLFMPPNEEIITGRESNRIFLLSHMEIRICQFVQDSIFYDPEIFQGLSKQHEHCNHQLYQ